MGYCIIRNFLKIFSGFPLCLPAEAGNSLLYSQSISAILHEFYCAILCNDYYVPDLPARMDLHLNGTITNPRLQSLHTLSQKLTLMINQIILPNQIYPSNRYLLKPPIFQIRPQNIPRQNQKSHALHAWILFFHFIIFIIFLLWILY